jgi:hypothetical protein
MSFDGSRIGRSQITDSRVRNVATCTGEATLFCGVRTWCERPCSRRVTSGASPHRWFIPGGTSRVSARVPGAGSVATARPHSTGGRQHGCYLPHFLMAGAHFAVREVDHKQDRRREGAGLRFKL